MIVKTVRPRDWNLLSGLLYGAIGVEFLAFSVVEIEGQLPKWVAVLAVVLLGCTATAIARRRLRVRQDGLEISDVFTHRFVPWSDVASLEQGEFRPPKAVFSILVVKTQSGVRIKAVATAWMKAPKMAELLGLISECASGFGIDVRVDPVDFPHARRLSSSYSRVRPAFLRSARDRDGFAPGQRVLLSGSVVDGRTGTLIRRTGYGAMRGWKVDVDRPSLGDFRMTVLVSDLRPLAEQVDA